METTWDYIVIGAGHNGFTAGCTLAAAGKSVLIVEQRPITGGLSASHAYVAGAPNHLLSIGAMDDALMAHSPLIDLFNLRSHGYASIPLAAPYGWMGDNGETLLLHKDFARTVAEIHYFSPKDAQTYIDLRGAIDFVVGGLEGIMMHHPAHLPKLDNLKRIITLATDKPVRKILGRMLSLSAFEMISETFESDAMRGLWAFWCSMFAPATAQASGVYLASFGSVHRAGIFRPRGGMSGMISAFEQHFTSNGGQIMLNSKVEQLLMEGQKVTGVHMASGENFYARHAVLANCAPQVALGKLLPASAKDRQMQAKIDSIPANSVAVAPFKIDIAVGGPLTYPKAQAARALRDDVDVRKTTFMTGTLEQHIAQHKSYLRGEPVTFLPPLYFAIMSANDALVAPKGEDVLYLYVNVPVHPIGEWGQNKAAYSAQIMTNAANYIGGLEAEIGRVETTPLDFEEQFGAPNGAYFHVDMKMSRMLMNRPAPGLGGYKTPFPGLYLAGAGSHPSGGVCGWAGRLAAQCAMKNAS